MTEYNYYIQFTERDIAFRETDKETPLTIHDLKDNMCAAEIMDEIYDRIAEDFKTVKAAIKIKNICLLSQFKYK